MANEENENINSDTPQDVIPINEEEKKVESLLNASIPLWKVLILILLLALVGVAVYYSIQGHFITVISIIASILFGVGFLLLMVFVISKETFLYLIGRRSEYKKLLEASNSFAIGGVNTLISNSPKLSKEEKENLKKDTPFMVQYLTMLQINSFITRFFIGAFAAAFGLLGTIVLMKQNQKIEIQNHLMEAERRSSLVFLMSNILDKVDDEIKTQQNELKANKIKIAGNTKYSLSKPLMGRIIALSKAFKPYYSMEGNTLSKKVLSPERGQLFIALMSNNLDSLTQNSIVLEGDFSNAQINFINLKGADLSGADLSRADLSRANLREAKSLYNCKGLNDSLKAKLQKEKPLPIHTKRMQLNAKTINIPTNN